MIKNGKPFVPIPRFIHVSIDDVNTILKELGEGDYNSIYQHEVFNFLKNMNVKYGAVFSLYCFNQNPDKPSWALSSMTDRFRDDFSKASLWLKFGFHAQSMSSRYGDTIKSEEALEHYNSFIDSVKNFAGAALIDRIPRIHYFSGTVEHARKWKNADYGVKGFLSADDKREINCYLNAAERDILEEKPFYYEEKESMYFFKTKFRLENISDVTQAFEDMKKNCSTEQQSVQIIFTHEKYLYDKQMQSKIEYCCKWANKNNYAFLYPMNIV